MICRCIIRLVVMCALFLGVTMLPLFVATSHDSAILQTEVTHHAKLDAVVTLDDGHTHDDGEAYERQIGHMHGHDPADHSHQVVFLGSTSYEDRQNEKDKPVAAVSGVIHLEARFGIDRPPKLYSRG